MRQGQTNRRSRSRNRGRSGNPATRTYESNGPEVKIKGTAAHIADKYLTLARDALSSGHTVTAENYMQHAEHYNRIIMAAQARHEEQLAARANGRERRKPAPVPIASQPAAAIPAPASAPVVASPVVAKPPSPDSPGIGEQPKLDLPASLPNSEAEAEKPRYKPRTPRKPVKRPRATAKQAREARQAREAKLQALEAEPQAQEAKQA